MVWGRTIARGTAVAAMTVALGACLFAPPRPGADDGGVGDDGGMMQDADIDGEVPTCDPTSLADLSVTAAIPARANTDYLVRAGADHGRAMIYLYEPHETLSILRSCSDHRAELTPAGGDARVVALGRLGDDQLLAMVWEKLPGGVGVATAVILELPELAEVMRSAQVMWSPPPAGDGASVPFIAYGEKLDTTPPVKQVWFGASEIFVWDLTGATTAPVKPSLTLGMAGAEDKLLLATDGNRGNFPLFDAVGKLGTYTAAHLQGPGNSIAIPAPRALRDNAMCTAPQNCPPQIARPIHGGPVFDAKFTSVVAPVEGGNAYILDSDSATSIKMTIPGFTGKFLDLTVANMPPLTMGLDLVAIEQVDVSMRELVVVDEASTGTPGARRRVTLDQNQSHLVVGRFGGLGETQILVLDKGPRTTATEEACFVNGEEDLATCPVTGR